MRDILVHAASAPCISAGQAVVMCVCVGGGTHARLTTIAERDQCITVMRYNLLLIIDPHSQPSQMSSQVGTGGGSGTFFWGKYMLNMKATHESHRPTFSLIMCYGTF